MIGEKVLYLAANRDGRCNVFTSLPERSDAFGIWAGNMESCYAELLRALESEGLVLPDITYKDDPMPLRLHISSEK